MQIDDSQRVQYVISSYNITVTLKWTSVIPPANSAEAWDNVEMACMQYFGNRSAFCFVTSVRNHGGDQRVLLIGASGVLSIPTVRPAFLNNLRTHVVLKAVGENQSANSNVTVEIRTHELTDHSLFE